MYALRKSTRSAAGETVERLIDRVRHETPKLSLVRDRSRAPVFAAVKRIEAALVAALDGEHLRAYTLSRRMDEAPVLKGIRITGGHADGLLPVGIPQIVLRDDGMFVVATWSFAEGLRVEPAEEKHFLAEHLAIVIERTQMALQNHLVRVERTSATYAKAEHLAERLAQVLPPTF